MPLSVGLAAASRVLASSLGPGIRTLAGNVAKGAAWESGRQVANFLYGMFLEHSDLDVYDTPFAPGICDIAYGVTVTFRVQTPGGSALDGTFTAGTVVWGPIGRAGVLESQDPGLPSRKIFFIELTHYGPNNLPRSGPQRTTIAGPGGAFNESEVSILNVEAVPFPAGASGECPVLPPAPPYRPEDFTTDIDVTYPQPNGPLVTIPFTAIIAPFFVSNDLTLKMPITFKINPNITNNFKADFEVKATFDLSTGETEYNWGDDIEPPVAPPSLPPATRPPFTPGNEITPPKPPSIPDPTPLPPEDREGGELIGALVTVTSGSNAKKVSTIFQNDNPDILVPSVGHISFAIDAGDGRFGWTSDLVVKNMRCYIPVPPGCKATDVRGTPQPGFTWVITPIYTKVLVPA